LLILRILICFRSYALRGNAYIFQVNVGRISIASSAIFMRRISRYHAPASTLIEDEDASASGLSSHAGAW